jgi:uroporphyrin-III C-methyltransferase
LSSLIATLRFKILGVNQKLEEPAATITMTSWKAALHDSWKELKSLIKVTRIEDNPIPVAFDQQEQAQILRTLQLLNEQTQWAVLQGDSKVYIDTLQTLEKYVKSYFVEDEEQTALIRRIQQLEQQRVEIPVPDIAETLQALSRITIKKE